MSSCLSSFNPRARVGRDLPESSQVPSIISFNPRARVGRDFSRLLPGGVIPCFNPRARVGRDKVAINAPQKLPKQKDLLDVAINAYLMNYRDLQNGVGNGQYEVLAGEIKAL